MGKATDYYLFKSLLNSFDSIVFLDTETTGLDHEKDYVIEVGAVKVTDGGGRLNLDTFERFVRIPSSQEIPHDIICLTGITPEMLQTSGKPQNEVKDELEEFLGENQLVVAHNASFDLGFLWSNFSIAPSDFLCTRTIEFLTNPGCKLSLAKTYQRYYGPILQRHRALSDTILCKDVFVAQLKQNPEHILSSLNKLVAIKGREPKFLPPKSIVLDFTNLPGGVTNE